MGNYNVNEDGSVTKVSINKLSDIEWIDYNKVEKGSLGYVRMLLFFVYYVNPIFWPATLIYRLRWGSWILFEPLALENTNDKIRVFCNRKGKLGLYHINRGVILQAIFDSIEKLPTFDYPSFILKKKGKFCVLNYTRKKIIFKVSDKITYLGNNTVIIEKNGKSTKYSLIGMCIE